MQFPLDARFKLLALASQISVTDATGALILYSRQKAFKLKEAVTVFADEGQTRPLYRISADRILDISARYRIEDPGGVEVGTLMRQGMRSLWRAHYALEQNGRTTFTIREENPWIKLLDGIFGEIPIVSLFSGYVFNPVYLVSRADGPTILRVVKRPAFFEGHFHVEQSGPDPVPDAAVLAVLMMLSLERSRG